MLAPGPLPSGPPRVVRAPGGVGWAWGLPGRGARRVRARGAGRPGRGRRASAAESLRGARGVLGRRGSAQPPEGSEGTSGGCPPTHAPTSFAVASSWGSSRGGQGRDPGGHWRPALCCTWLIWRLKPGPAAEPGPLCLGAPSPASIRQLGAEHGCPGALRPDLRLWTRGGRAGRPPAAPCFSPRPPALSRPEPPPRDREPFLARFVCVLCFRIPPCVTTSRRCPLLPERSGPGHPDQPPTPRPGAGGGRP